MRTFRLIGMTLLMVLCAVNFTACSDDEDGNTNTAKGINPQNVFVNGMPNQVADMKITRDESGLVSKIETKNAVATFKYPAAVRTRAELSNQLVIMELIQNAGDVHEEKFIYHMEIGNNGFIKHCEEIVEMETWDFTYTAEGNMLSVQHLEGEMENTTITYQDGNIIKTSTASVEDPNMPRIYTLNYTSNAVTTPIENKGCLMFFNEILGVELHELEIVYYAGLLGKATKHLPVESISQDSYESWEINTQYSWTLNANGLPTLLNIQTEFGYKDEISIVW